MRLPVFSLILACVGLSSTPCFSASSSTSIDFPNAAPGKAKATIEGDTLSLSNDILTAKWKVKGKTLVPLGITSKLPNAKDNALKPDASAELFRLSTIAPTDPENKDPAIDFNLPSSTFVMTKPPKQAPAPLDKTTPRASAGIPGQSFTATFENKDAGIVVHWRAELRDGSGYVKEDFVIEAVKPIDLKGIQLLELSGDEFKIVGNVPGSPIVGQKGGTFAGVELPVSRAKLPDPNHATMGFACKLPMQAKAKNQFSTVKGVWNEDQLRRSFMHYLERERAMPYAPFLHYNGWYDMGLNPTEEKMLTTIKGYDEELVKKRGVKLDSFVLDDGWDDCNEALWQPSTKKFPNGFGKVKKALDGVAEGFGIWVSPLGGYYGVPERVAQAKKLKVLPEDAKDFDFSYPEFAKWYQDRCTELIKKDGVNYFKWDRAGEGVSPHFMALTQIAKELKKVNPHLFINTTVGTWPSPFWLNFIDSTWRGGADVFWTGKGDKRDKYVTFRDGYCYAYICLQAPLYPINSMMHHGMVLGTEFQGGEMKDAKNELKNDSRMFFASGANLQELYLTPSLMTEQGWDDVAEAAKWARKFAPVLVDVHWIAGNPNENKIYGFAAYNKGGATLALRNPDDAEQEVEIDAQTVFEPTKDAPAVFKLKASYPDQRIKELELKPGSPVKLKLEPFEVLVFDIPPQGAQGAKKK